MKSSYPGLLVIANVILLLTSTILLYLGISLISFYHLDKLDFVASWFYVVPYVMIGLGVGSFAVALYGCLVAIQYSRPQLYIYSLLMVLLFVVQLVGVFSSMELRGVVNRAEFTGIDILSDLEHYLKEPATRHKWDTLHREFHCCGGINYNDGFKIWRNADIGLERNSVPDSCCLRPSENCGRNLFTELDATLSRKIHTHGCLTLLQDKLSNQVVPVLLTYAAVGTGLALVQLLCVVFACAFAAAISRHALKEEEGDRRSLRSNVTYQNGGHDITLPTTPRFDHIRGHYVADNMNAVYEQEQQQLAENEKLGRFTPTNLDERPV